MKIVCIGLCLIASQYVMALPNLTCNGKAIQLGNSQQTVTKLCGKPTLTKQKIKHAQTITKLTYYHQNENTESKSQFTFITGKLVKAEHELKNTYKDL